MWPLSDTQEVLGEGPARIDVIVRVCSPSDVVSPLSGRVAAFVHVQVVERVASAEHLVLGEVIFGDLVTLGAEAQSDTMPVRVLVRRAVFRRVTLDEEPRPIERVAPEIVPLLGRATRGGMLCYREHVVLPGDRLRLRATVERVSEGVRVRDDLGQVRLDQVLGSL
jgi:hypothetical protein